MQFVLIFSEMFNSRLKSMIPEISKSERIARKKKFMRHICKKISNLRNRSKKPIQDTPNLTNDEIMHDDTNDEINEEQVIDSISY